MSKSKETFEEANERIARNSVPITDEELETVTVEAWDAIPAHLKGYTDQADWQAGFAWGLKNAIDRLGNFGMGHDEIRNALGLLKP